MIVRSFCLPGDGPEVAPTCLVLSLISVWVLLLSLSVLADFLSDLFSCPQRLPPHRAAWQPLRLSILPTFKHLKYGFSPTVSTQQIFHLC